MLCTAVELSPQIFLIREMRGLWVHIVVLCCAILFVLLHFDDSSWTTRVVNQGTHLILITFLRYLILSISRRLRHRPAERHACRAAHADPHN